jgi:hypothetical protein
MAAEDQQAAGCAEDAALVGMLGERLSVRFRERANQAM